MVPTYRFLLSVTLLAAVAAMGCNVSVGLDKSLFACSSDDDCTEGYVCFANSAVGRTVCTPRSDVPSFPTTVCERVDWTCDAGECHDDFCEDSETERVWVPAGSFFMGCNSAVDSSCESDERPQHDVALDAFMIDKYEVTVANYRICVESGGCSAPASGCPASQIDDRPIVCVNWQQARTYCQVHDGDLCSEAQWELAARRPCELIQGDCASQMPLYPWGEEEPNCGLAVQSADSPGCDTGATFDVGATDGRSVYGAHDMAGNVREWVLDCYHPSYEGAPADGSPWMSGCEDGAASASRVLRGGDFRSGFSELRTSDRHLAPADEAADNIGFRCCAPVR